MDDKSIQYAIKMKVENDYEKGCAKLGLTPRPVKIRFDLKGKAAGQMRGHELRFNMDIVRNNYASFMQRTPTHEVAHILTSMKYPYGSAHGREWQYVMSSVFGLEPSRCHSYDMSNVPVRTQGKHAYKCACDTYYLTTAKHNKIQNGYQRCQCRKCRQTLTHVR